MSTSARPVLDSQDMAWLVERDIVAPSSNGMLKLPRRFYNSSSSSSSDELSALSLTSSPISSTSSAGDFIEFPEKLASPATYRFFGFDEDTSDLLFSRWRSLPDLVRHEDDVLEVAEDYLKNAGFDASCAADDWDGTLRKLGVGGKLRDVLTRPEYIQLICAESAVWHLIDTCQMRWRSLTVTQEISKARRRNITGQSSQPAVDAQRTESVYSYSQGYGHISQATSAEVRQNEPGQTKIYRAVGRERAKDMMRPELYPAEQLLPGQFTLTPIISSAPSDFSGRTGLFYFSLSTQGAQVYADFIKHKAGPRGVCLIEITIPNYIISSMNPYILDFPSDVFKKTVYYSRAGQDLKSVKGCSEIAHKDLLIGDTTTGVNKKIAGLPSWEDISERNLITLPDGSRLKQFVFDGKLEDAIKKHCQGTLRFSHYQTLKEISWADLHD